ncbi:threonine/serine exporter family protein [Helicobacter aurati]|nr:threonine/serine exporter family protein [Helicobacter aurati]
MMESFPQIAEILYTDFFSSDSFEHIGINMIFAMIAALGFGYPFNPPKKILFGIIIIAGLGYLIRSILMLFPIFSLAAASFFASLCMGGCAMVIAKRVKVPVEVIVFPGLLPMFPGSYGYKSIISLLTFLQNTDKPEQINYLLAFFNNFITMTSVSLSLVAGALVTFIIFFEQSFMITRGSKQTSIYTIFRELRKNKKAKTS